MSFLYSFVSYLHISGSESITSVGEREQICLLLFTCKFVFLLGEVTYSSGYLGLNVLFYCDTP